MADKNKGRLVVDISALELDQKELKDIESSINKVVLDAISRRRPKWDTSFRVFDLSKFGPWTLGIWLGDIDDDGIPDNFDPDIFGG